MTRFKRIRGLVLLLALACCLGLLPCAAVSARSAGQTMPEREARSVHVVITGHNGEYLYDGTEKTVEGYDVSIDDDRYTEKDFSFKGTARVSAVNANAYDMGLKAEDFVNNNPDFEVVFEVIDGSLLIIGEREMPTAGEDLEDIMDEPVPLAPYGSWALADLLAAVGTAGIAACLLVLHFIGRKAEAPRRKKRLCLALLSLVPAAAAALILLLAEDLHARMVPAGGWTPVQAVLLALSAAAAWLFFREWE